MIFFENVFKNEEWRSTSFQLMLKERQLRQAWSHLQLKGPLNDSTLDFFLHYLLSLEIKDEDRRELKCLSDWIHAFGEFSQEELLSWTSRRLPPQLEDLTSADQNNASFRLSPWSWLFAGKRKNNINVLVPTPRDTDEIRQRERILLLYFVKI